MGDSLEEDPITILIWPVVFDPWSQVLALADIEGLELVTAVRDRLNTGARDSNTPTHRESLHVQEVEADAAKGRIGDGGAAKRHVQIRQLRALEGKHFGCGVGQSATKRLYHVSICLTIMIGAKDLPSQAPVVVLQHSLDRRLRYPLGRCNPPRLAFAGW